MDEEGAAQRRVADEQRARAWFAGISATLSVVLVVAYYLPGLDDTTDGGGSFLLLSLPAALMAFPFLLFALLL